MSIVVVSIQFEVLFIRIKNWNKSNNSSLKVEHYGSEQRHDIIISTCQTAKRLG